MPEVIHIFSEQYSKGSLLAEVHRLQSSLAAMRQARDFHGANSADLMRERDRLQEHVRVLRDAAHFVSHLSAESYSPWADGLRMTRAALAATEPKP